MVLFVLLNVIGMGLLASGLSFASISLYDRSAITAPSTWIRTTGIVCGVTKLPNSAPPQFQAKVCYHIKNHRYFVMDLSSPVEVTLGAKRTILYNPKNPSSGRDVGQAKPNWMALLKEGVVLALVGVGVLIYSLRKVLKVRR